MRLDSHENKASVLEREIGEALKDLVGLGWSRRNS
jgi:hypothetical protein